MVLALPLIIGKLTVATIHTIAQEAGLWLLKLLPDLFNLRIRLKTVTLELAPEVITSVHQSSS
jgi:hypothetical protein